VLTEKDAAEYLRWKKHQEGVRTGASEIADIVAGIAAALADAAEGTARLADALRQRDSDRQPS
jgi:hypothetical protein